MGLPPPHLSIAAPDQTPGKGLIMDKVFYGLFDRKILLRNYSVSKDNNPKPRISSSIIDFLSSLGDSEMRASAVYEIAEMLQIPIEELERELPKEEILWKKIQAC
jgi:hypothetical protein